MPTSLLCITHGCSEAVSSLLVRAVDVWREGDVIVFVNAKLYAAAILAMQCGDIWVECEPMLMDADCLLTNGAHVRNDVSQPMPACVNVMLCHCELMRQMWCPPGMPRVEHLAEHVLKDIPWYVIT